MGLGRLVNLLLGMRGDDRVGFAKSTIHEIAQDFERLQLGIEQHAVHKAPCRSEFVRAQIMFDTANSAIEHNGYTNFAAFGKGAFVHKARATADRTTHDAEQWTSCICQFLRDDRVA